MLIRNHTLLETSKGRRVGTETLINRIKNNFTDQKSKVASSGYMGFTL